MIKHNQICTIVKTDTCKTLNKKDDNSIELFQQQIGGLCITQAKHECKKSLPN